MKTGTVIYFDMDGVLAKWESDGDWTRNGYFLQREVDLKVKSLINELLKRGFDVRILSSAATLQAKMEKLTWLYYEGLDMLPVTFVQYGSSKAREVSTVVGKKILIDDFSANLFDWETNQNIAIKYRNGQNGTKGTWKGRSISERDSVQDMISIVMSVA